MVSWGPTWAIQVSLGTLHSAPLGPDVDFDGFWGPLRTHFGIICVTFSRFASSISKYEPQGADFRRKLFGNSLFAELAPLSSRLLAFEVSGWALGSLWDTLAHILVSFDDPGCTFSDF